MERGLPGRFPPAAVSKWSSASKSLFMPQLEELLPVHDYWDVLLSLPKEGTALSPEQWNSTRQCARPLPLVPVKSGPTPSQSLSFPSQRWGSSPTSSQPAPNVREAVLSSLVEVQSDSEEEGKVAAN